MNVSILRSLALLGICAAASSAVFGQMNMQQPTRVQIPFDFTVGQKSFGAGDYQVWQAERGVLAIQSRDNKSAVYASVQPSDRVAASRDSVVLTFHKYADRYFLSQVSNPDNGWALHQSAAEQEIIAKTGSPANVAVRASRVR